MTELATMVKTIDLQIDALSKVKAALIAAMGALGTRQKVVPFVQASKGAPQSLREFVLEALRRARHPLKKAELMASLEQLGWRSTGDAQSVLDVQLRKYCQTKEVKRTGRRRAFRYRLGVVRPAKPVAKQPWEKKLAAAKALVKAA